MADHPLADVLDNVTAPVRVGVSGRPGTGRDTVRSALRGVGAAVAARGEVTDIDVYVFCETLAPEDLAALAAARRPVVAVLNKADLTCFRGDGPMAVAARRCRELERRTGVPTRPLAALLAVAASPGGLHQSLIDALGTVTVEPARLIPAMGRRLLTELDLYGIAVASTAVSDGADAAMLAGVLRNASGITAVLDEIERASAPIRYRRLVSTLAGLAEHAVGPRGARVAHFLASDAVVLARMAAAIEVVAVPERAADGSDECAAQLRRAIHWQHYACGPVSALHRACGADIARGALRLWVRSGGCPEPIP